MLLIQIKVLSEITMKTGSQLYSIFCNQRAERTKHGQDVPFLEFMTDTEVALVQTFLEIIFTSL